ncbi:Archaeal Lon protease [uncultured archaeon]|nr:Archaeal Lon protease [uncultured archaeon]
MRYLIFLGFIALLLFLGFYFNSTTAQAIQTQNSTDNYSNSSISNSLTYNLKLPAVDSKDKGILADLELVVSPGEGKVYTRIDGDNPLVNTDTQNSMKRAVTMARTYTQIKDKDLYFSMNSGSDVVGGVSAGAAFTIMSIAALKGDTLRNDTLITGSIEVDGSIGPVGKVLEKAGAVKKAGYTRFLVPKGEGVATEDNTSCVSKDFGNGFYQTCSSTPVEINIQNLTGLQIIEVNNFTQAYDLMILK